MDVAAKFAPVVFWMMVATTPFSVAVEGGEGDQTPKVEAVDFSRLAHGDGDLAEASAAPLQSAPDLPSSTLLRPAGRDYSVVSGPLVEVSSARRNRSLEERDLWRFVFDNDGFVHKDNAFTNGWSIQRHSRQHDNWLETGPSKFSGWISRTIPGLGDVGDRVVKRGAGLSQITMTPEDISNPDPQPGDVPWAGALGWAESWYAFNNSSLKAFQIYFGILGPYSLAETFQIQIHDWINADEALGWDNQLATEPLLNLNYAFKRKLISAGEYMGESLAADLAVGLEGALGNLETSAGLTLEGRFGWGLPLGFTQLPDPAGDGIMLDPEKDCSGRFHLYFSVIFRVSATGHSVFFDGNLLRRSPHPGLEYDAVSHSTVFGLHADRGRYAIHFNFYKYNDLPFESVNPLTDLTWGNITFEYRF